MYITDVSLLLYMFSFVITWNKKTKIHDKPNVDRLI